MFKAYYSNDLDTLFNRFAEVTADPIGEALRPETVVTPSRAMARWLAIHLAEQQAIAANIQFSLPAAFIWNMFFNLFPEANNPGVIDRESLTWRLMSVLPTAMKQPEFAPLTHYLGEESPEHKRYQLCRQIADVFDQYLVYRPDLLRQWETGQEDHWQARLWRAVSDGERLHRANLIARFLDPALNLDPTRLPRRICLFGIPTLPPTDLEVIVRLATVIDIHLFVLNPCLLYWGDIQDSRNIARIRQQRARLGKPQIDDYLTSGNSLLASLGRQGRDFIDALQDHTAENEDLFVQPTSVGVLGVLQTDILALEERGRSAPKLPLPTDDHSLQIHICHSPLREVEILHDQLLARFDADPTLVPQDIVVMTPDIEQWAPYIEAVFGAAPENRQIPYAIADLSRQDEQPEIQLFLRLLTLPESRFSASEVLSLLEQPILQRRFGFTEDDIEILHRWVREVGIRWGLGPQSWSAFGSPELNANTWDFGFRRLFLGYAMAPTGDRLFENVLPYTDVEGRSAELLGRLRTFVDRLADFSNRLNQHYNATEWVNLINDLLTTFFHPDEEESDSLQSIRETLAHLLDHTQTAGYSDPFGIDILRDHLSSELNTAHTRQRLLTGRLTFCAMIPMRSLPFRIIALIGMNDGAFPRQSHSPGFDLMVQEPRKGDRSRREEDRYLFLEALISARDQFYISYVGRNIRDNSPQPPSVLVSELLDYIDQAFEAETHPPHQQLLTEHPLQPFSTRYFGDDPALYSYATEWIPALEAKTVTSPAIPAFCSTPLKAPDLPHGPQLIDLADLRRFFRHPVREFLRNRLGIGMDQDNQPIDDHEPFALDGLQRHQLHETLLENLLSEIPNESCRNILKARGSLPKQRFGELLLDEESMKVEKLKDVLKSLCLDPLPDQEIDLQSPHWRLTGRLEHLTRQGLVRYRVGTAKARDLISLWIEHLILNVVATEHTLTECPAISLLIDGENKHTLTIVDNARTHLDDLINLYRQGQQKPLKLMPQTAYAYAYAQALATEKPAMTAANKAWQKDHYNHGEEDDDVYRIAFRGDPTPLDNEFVTLAETIYRPLVAHLEIT